MTTPDPSVYIELAKQQYGCDDIDVLDIVDTSPDDGAWVSALLWVDDSQGLLHHQRPGTSR